jgi:hypothetical protein
VAEDFEALLNPSAAPRVEDQTPLDTGPIAGPPEPPLTDEEFQEMQESLVTAAEVAEELGVPEEPDLTGSSLRLLRDDEVPVVGTHYVVWGDPAKPMPVVVGSYAVPLKQHISGLTGTEPKDVRAMLYASWRYKGYLCGQVNGL